MKLSKEKKQHIMLVWIVGFALVVGIWMYLINVQKESTVKLKSQIQDAKKKFSNAKSLVQNKEKWESDFLEAQKQLKAIEMTMASGDLSGWFSTTLSTVTEDHNVDIIQNSSPFEKEVEILPVFPYKAAVSLVEGTAYFQDFGRFIADLENSYPYVRVQNIELIPAPNMPSSEMEKLQFRMELVVLIKPRDP